MKNKEELFLILSILLLLLLIIFKPVYGWKIRQFLSFNSQPKIDVSALKDENTKLQSEIAQFSSLQSQISTGTKNYIPAMVYSEYPMNFKNQLTLDVGSNEGIIKQKAVLFNNYFIGYTTNVFPNYSVVQTIFDGDFKMPVKIGNSLYDGLLIGGTSPIIGSISKKASISAGDVIISADSRFSYGLPIGIVRDVKISSDNLFQTATVDFTYSAQDINSVSVQK